mmetsp:Transcript_7310/g.14297  ORF Transcript_7310/g.14297 Transcript_7310/m.14297 type:complete len:211 (+) Transcript_7310:544-1176(+)
MNSSEAPVSFSTGPPAPIFASPSTLLTISMDSGIAVIFWGSCGSVQTKIGTIFLPTRRVGMSTSSFASQMSSCLIFFSPKMMRARTQKGQWSYTYSWGRGPGGTILSSGTTAARREGDSALRVRRRCCSPARNPLASTAHERASRPQKAPICPIIAHSNPVAGDFTARETPTRPGVSSRLRFSFKSTKLSYGMTALSARNTILERRRIKA